MASWGWVALGIVGVSLVGCGSDGSDSDGGGGGSGGSAGAASAGAGGTTGGSGGSGLAPSSPTLDGCPEGMYVPCDGLGTCTRWTCGCPSGVSENSSCRSKSCVSANELCRAVCGGAEPTLVREAEPASPPELCVACDAGTECKGAGATCIQATDCCSCRCDGTCM